MSTNEPAENAEPRTSPGVGRKAGRARRLTWPLGLAVGIVAATLTGGLGEVTANWHNPDGDPSLGPLQGGGATVASVRRATLQNAVLTYGMQGGVLGVLLGLAGGFTVRSARRAIAGALVGAVLGAVAGGAAAYGAFSVLVDKVDPLSDNLIPPLLAHAIVWGLLGAAGGFAFGVGAGRRIARATLGGLLGAALGAFLYEIGGALLFASDKTTRPIADGSAARLLGHAATNVLASLGAVIAIVGSARKEVARPHDRWEGE